ncbi:MAG: DNA polymerase III subunit gamma/tau, partial [Bacteroidota bacterium]|nr:DNA polymerase III subunit gamma/tau [Bacteroidota bacterium]
VKQLKYVAVSEQKEAEEEALNVIAVKADGGMRDALSIFDQVASYGNGRITYQGTIENLNVLDYDYYFKLTACLLGGDVSGALLIFNDILNNGFDGQQFITGLTAHFRDLLVCKDPSTLVLLEVGANIRHQYQQQAADCPAEFLYTAIKFGNDCDLSYRESRNKRLLVELTLIRIAQLPDSKKKIPELVEEERPAPILPIQVDQPEQHQPDGQQQPVSIVPGPSPEQVPEPASAKQAPDRSVQASASTKSAPSFKESSTGTELSGYRAIRSIRLGSLRKNVENTTDKPAPEPVEQTRNKPFSQQDLENAWIGFTAQIADDVHLVNSMKSSQPVLLSENKYEVVVSNQVVQKKLDDLKYRIETYLHETLQNTFISISFKLDETGETARPFTARERMESMVKKNPNLLDFYRRFGLEID